MRFRGDKKELTLIKKGEIESERRWIQHAGMKRGRGLCFPSVHEESENVKRNTKSVREKKSAAFSISPSVSTFSFIRPPSFLLAAILSRTTSVWLQPGWRGLCPALQLSVRRKMNLHRNRKLVRGVQEGSR